MIIEEAKHFILDPTLISWVGIFGTILGLIGIVLSCYFYFKAKRSKEPKYAIRSGNLIRESVGRFRLLQIKYGDDKVITNFTVSRVAFWNDGNETIKGEDIAELDPLQIKISAPYEILDADVMYKSSKANGFDIEFNPGQDNIPIKFKFLDKHNGGIIQVLHTGKSSADLAVNGIITGAGNVNKSSSRTMWVAECLGKVADSLRVGKRVKGYVLFLTPFVILAMVLWGQKPIKNMDIYMLILTSSIYWITAFYLLKRRVPIGFEMFEEQITSNNTGSIDSEGD